MEQKTLLEYLTGPLEHERVLAVAELVFQAEGYVRALAQAITGLAVKAALDEGAMRDFCAVRRNADEVSAWLAGHHQVLYQHVQPDAIAAVEKTEEPQQAATLH